MNNPFDEAFSKLEPPAGLDASEQGKQRRWEHKVVGTIVDHFNLQGRRRDMIDMVGDSAGFRALTFDAFYKTFDTFPIYLAARKIPWVWKTTIEDLVRGFHRTRVFKAFQQSEDDMPPGWHNADRFGLVFEWLKVWPVAIIHNYYHASRDTGTVISYYQASTGVRFALQSFDSFLGSLPWTP